MRGTVIEQSVLFGRAAGMPAASMQGRKALIAGPVYQVVRFDETAERANGSLGAYVPGVATTYSWPNIVSGAVVETESVEVTFANALARVYTGTVESSYGEHNFYGRNGLTARNYVYSSTLTIAGTGLSAGFNGRSVAVGDTVDVAYGGTTVRATVMELLYEAVAATVAAAQEDTGNVSALLDSTSGVSEASSVDITKVGFGTSDVDIDTVTLPTARPEFAYREGMASDTYTFDVVTGGDVGTAVIRVTSASGKDDVTAFTPSAWDEALAFGARGVSVTFTNDSSSDEFEVGMQWTVVADFGTTNVAVTSGGTYTGLTDTTYVATVTRGGKFDGSVKPQITVRTLNGSDVSGPTTISALDTAYSVGTKGVTLTFAASDDTDAGLYLGDIFYVVVTAATAGRCSGVALSRNLPSAMLTGTPALVFNVYQGGTFAVESQFFTAGDDTIVIDAGIETSVLADDGVTELDAPIAEGSVYVSYRALRTDLAATAVSVTSATALGALAEENPIALAVQAALDNANGGSVWYLPVAGTNAEAFTEALEALEGSEGAYSIVPVSHDAEVISAVVAYVASESSAAVSNWVSAVVSPVIPAFEDVLTEDDNDDPITATIAEDPDRAGVYALLDTSASVDFVNEVSVGNLVYIFNQGDPSDYLIDSVSEIVGATTLKLTTGVASAISTAVQVTFVSHLKGAAYAAKLNASAAAISTASNVLVVAPTVVATDSGEAGDGITVAAAFAGLRGAVAPHQGLKGAKLEGMTSAVTAWLGTTGERALANGKLLVAGLQGANVYVVEAQDVTGAPEMHRRNLDNIRYTVGQVLSPYIGATNIVDTALVELGAALRTTLVVLQNGSLSQMLGAQLTAFTIVRVEASLTVANAIEVEIVTDTPGAMSNVLLFVV